MSPAYQGTIDHPVLGAVRYRMTEVSDDPDTQVAEVIGLMRELAIEDSTSPAVCDKARELVNAYGDELEAVHGYTRGLMQFVSDEATVAPLQAGYSLPIVEALIRPVDQLAAPRPMGDCDDFTMLAASLLCALDVPVAFCTVAADGGAPDIYSHVYAVAYPTRGKFAGQRVALDCSHGDYPGWETGNRFGKRREWPVTRAACIMPWVGAAVLGLLLYSKTKSRGAF